MPAMISAGEDDCRTAATASRSRRRTERRMRSATRQTIEREPDEDGPASAPLRAWTASVTSRIQFLSMKSRPRWSAHCAHGAESVSGARPLRTETPSAGDEGQRGVGPGLDQFVDAHRQNDRTLRARRSAASRPLSCASETRLVHARLGAPPCGVALAGENVADLVGKPAEIVAQRLQIALDVAGRRRTQPCRTSCTPSRASLAVSRACLRSR